LLSGDSVGHFSAPSLTGAVLGVGSVNQDQYPDLFLQGDMWKPGVYLYHFKKFSEDGVPVFSQPVTVEVPFENTGSNRGTVMQKADGSIYGFWKFGSSLMMCGFDRKNNQFLPQSKIAVKGLTRGFSTFGILPLSAGKYLMVFSVQQKGVFSDPKRSADSAYYTPAGMWPFDLPKVGIYGAIVDDIEDVKEVQPVALTDDEQITFSISGFTLSNIDGQSYLIAGSRLGNFNAYKIDERTGMLEGNKHVVDPAHIILRHPTVHSYPGYFTSPEGKDGFIASGEGGIYFYANLKKLDQRGNLVFDRPSHLLQENPILNGGTLVVPNLVDWDGDGVLDIVSGTSTGHILFFKNVGTHQKPVYQAPVRLEAGGYEIHIQPGYREDIQGPGEARWGYSAPNVYDWDGDGLLDILTGDSRGKFMIYRNKGSRTAPKLEPERPLFVDGMNMHGSWRVKPGIAKLGERNAYIILDRDNELHLYWQLDAYNLEDGGKLKLSDGKYIKANRRPGGQVGRVKIHIVDWNKDGIKDLLLGTGRSNSVPNPTKGLPYNNGKKNEGGAVLFLKNTGTDSQPVFEYPKMLKYKGKPMLFGVHDCAPVTGPIGSDNENNLLVGTEYGTYIYYRYEDLEW
jgi:hypothetical protein